jgi:tRNA threonylcarbamoyladenosine biosynthesis protein TsaB
MEYGRFSAVLTLGIDTATRTGGVALVEGGKVVSSRTCPLRLTHSESLLPVVAELLEESAVSLSRVKAVAVAAGPGSFTGLRVGLATAKGLAVGKELPVVGVPTMEALALPYRDEKMPVWILLPSRRDHVFTGLFRWTEGRDGWEVERLRPEENRRVEEFLSDLVEAAFLAGPGLPEVEDAVHQVAGSLVHIDARSHQPSDGSGVAILGERLATKGEGKPPALVRPFYVVDRVAKPLAKYEDNDEGTNSGSY